MSKIKKTVNQVTVGYVTVTLLYQIIWLIAPIRAFLFATGMDIVSSCLALLGFALLAWDAVTDRLFLKNNITKLLMLVVLVLCLSSLVNFRYGLSKNAKVVIWQMVQMLVMFPLCYRIRDELHGRFLTVVHAVSSIVIIPAILISLYQFCFFIFYNIDIDGSAARQGFQGGRLFGVFASIYFACLFSAILCILSVYLAVRAKNIPLRVLYALESVTCLVYIILSDTRSVQVGLLTVLFIGAFFIYRASSMIGGKIENSFLRGGACLLLAMATVVCGIAVYTLSAKALKRIPVSIVGEEYISKVTAEENKSNYHANNNNNQSIEKPPQTNNAYKDNDENSVDNYLDRIDTSSENISNGRFQIWQDYIEATMSNIVSILFGYGPGSYMDAIRENHPDAFIVSKIKNSYPAMYDQGLIYDTHNAYLSIFVTSGLIGVLVMTVFLICCAVKVFRYLITSKNHSWSVMALALVLIMILVVSFFDSDMFFKTTDTSMIFWIVSGFLLCLIDRESKKESTATAPDSELNKTTQEL